MAAIGPLDEAAMAATKARLDQLTKPPGSLGRLERLAIQLAGITGDPASRVEPRAIVVMAADHGVAAQGVSAYPSAVTAQMVANFLAGGAAINALARHAGAEIVVVDLGVANPIPQARSGPSVGRFISAPIRPGSGDISVGPAMSRAEAIAAIDVGLGVAADLAAAGVRLVGVGEMGIANTTAASAVASALTGRPVREVTGRGTGVDDAAYRRKLEAVQRALEVNHPRPEDPLAVLAAVGGFEIGGLVGLMLGGAAAGIPLILDGFITGAAAIIAVALCPRLPPRLIASHRSVEPGHAILLDRLGLVPLLDLELRLGEGTGAALAMHLIDAACRARDEMATFASAGLSGQDSPHPQTSKADHEPAADLPRDSRRG
jgi:nicotinate-nucleotide--dimethylbenzimidazole phosphoribosyltransferase